MLRTKLTLLSLVGVIGVLAVSAVGATGASAACYKVKTAATGQFEESNCKGAAGTKEYIKARIVTKIGAGEWCAKVETAGTGTFENSACTTAGGTKEFIKVLAPVGGPVWTAEEQGQLEATASRGTKSEGVSEFELKTTEATIKCTAEKNSGTLIGGNPGTDQTTVLFTGCGIVGKAGCTVKSISPSPAKGAGEIELGVKTVLVYPNGSPESGTEADDALFPEGRENLFVKLKIEGGVAACSTLNNKEPEVKATGTAVTKEPAFKKRCGVLAEVGKVAGAVFARTAAGVEALEGALKFPGTLVKAELWKPGASAFANIECKLEAPPLGAAEEIGLTKVETWPEPEDFGWTA